MFLRAYRVLRHLTANAKHPVRRALAGLRW